MGLDFWFLLWFPSRSLISGRRFQLISTDFTTQCTRFLLLPAPRPIYPTLQVPVPIWPSQRMILISWNCLGPWHLSRNLLDKPHHRGRYEAIYILHGCSFSGSAPRRIMVSQMHILWEAWFIWITCHLQFLITCSSLYCKLPNIGGVDGLDKARICSHAVNW